MLPSPRLRIVPAAIAAQPKSRAKATDAPPKAFSHSAYALCGHSTLALCLLPQLSLQGMPCFRLALRRVQRDVSISLLGGQLSIASRFRSATLRRGCCTFARQPLRFRPGTSPLAPRVPIEGKIATAFTAGHRGGRISPAPPVGWLPRLALRPPAYSPSTDSRDLETLRHRTRSMHGTLPDAYAHRKQEQGSSCRNAVHNVEICGRAMEITAASARMLQSRCNFRRAVDPQIAPPRTSAYENRLPRTMPEQSRPLKSALVRAVCGEIF